MEGQKKLKAAQRAADRRRRPRLAAGLYLAAAGVGRIGLVDFDVVDFSNLQRQVIHGTKDVGRPKLHSAARPHPGHQPGRRSSTCTRRCSTSENALEIVRDYDIIIDGTDNFPTRYLVNDACVLLGKPNVYGSIFRFDGQASVFWAEQGPCYRCLYPEPPPPGLVPSCAEGGVLGVLPGIVGCIQATEAVKLILGKGEPLIGRLLLFDALQMRFRELKLRKDPKCPICGEHPTITKLIDYEQFCGIRRRAGSRPWPRSRRDHAARAEGAAGPRRPAVHPRRAQPGGVADLPARRRAPDPAARAAAALRRAGPGPGDGRPLQERHAQPEAIEFLRDQAGFTQAEEPEGRHRRLGARRSIRAYRGIEASAARHARVICPERKLTISSRLRKKSNPSSPSTDEVGGRVCATTSQLVRACPSASMRVMLSGERTPHRSPL